MRDVAEDYRTLLADGIVGYTGRAGPIPEEECLNKWESELVALAEADDLEAALFYMHMDAATYRATSDFGLDPCIALLHGDHSRDPGSNIYPYDQQAAADWHRPRAEAAWGETLAKAREARLTS